MAMRESDITSVIPLMLPFLGQCFGVSRANVGVPHFWRVIGSSNLQLLYVVIEARECNLSQGTASVNPPA